MGDRKVSIIVPVYNVAQYLCDCVESLLSQTYQNIEIILVDDGSTDQSGTICDQFQQRDSRVRVIHKENGGLSSARNAGIEIAAGDYFSFVDSDDWISRYMIERLLTAAVQANAEIAVCGFFQVEEDAIVPDSMDRPVEILTAEQALEKLICCEIQDYAWNKLYARKLFSQVRYPVGRNYEDMFTTYRLFLSSSQVVRIPDILYYYRIRSGSISNEKQQQKLLKNKADALLAQYERIDIIPREIPRLRNLVLRKFFRRSLDFLLFVDCQYRGEKVHAKGYRKQAMDWTREYASQIKGLDRFTRLKVGLLLWTDNRFFVLLERGKQIARRLPEPVKRLLVRIKVREKISEPKLDLPDSPCAILIGTPEHDNLGDHAIAYAAKALISPIFHGSVVEITEQQFLAHHRRIRKSIRSQDLVLIQGGGNWGNSYQYIEKIHRLILRDFRRQSIIVMPQTIYYTPDERGACSKNQDGILLKKCRDITFFFREKQSMAYFQENFPGIECRFTPDLVLSLNGIGDCQRSGCLFCVRSDRESALSAGEKRALLSVLEQEGFQVNVTDTSNGIPVSPQRRREALQAKWKQFQSAEFVLTDRLHGMIISYITGTPCIVFGNYNHKVQAAYDVISRYAQNICFIRTVQDLPEAIHTVTQAGPSDHLDAGAFDYGALVEKIQKAGKQFQ